VENDFARLGGHLSVDYLAQCEFVSHYLGLASVFAHFVDDGDSGSNYGFVCFSIHQ
jgi:hypothetical protein